MKSLTEKHYSGERKIRYPSCMELVHQHAWVGGHCTREIDQSVKHKLYNKYGTALLTDAEYEKAQAEGRRLALVLVGGIISISILIGVWSAASDTSHEPPSYELEEVSVENCERV